MLRPPLATVSLSAPAGGWTAWDHMPIVGLTALLAGALYVSGTQRLWRRAGRGEVVRPWQMAAFGSALMLLTVAIGSPLATLAHDLLAAHMVQHLLLILVAPPLLVLSAPLLPCVWGLGQRGRRLVHRLPRLHLARSTRAHSAALGAWLAATATLWLWHAPGIYELALRHEAVHLAEHATLLATACLYWWSVLRLPRALPGGDVLAVLSLFATAIFGGGLGALLAFAPAPWYDHYTATAPLWGVDALEDQQLAGMLMWVPTGIIYIGTAMALFVRWLQSQQRRAHDLDGGHGRLHRPQPPVVGWLLVTVGLLAACGTGLTDETLVDGADPAAGRSALRDYGCVSCHQVPGVPGPQGEVGPPLGGVAGRRVIAGKLPHSRENLAAWIQNPQQIDPGNVMPDLDVSDDDVRDIIAYLYSLE